MKTLNQLQLQGQYTVFYPKPKRKTDIYKKVISSVFGEDTKIYFTDDEGVSVFIEGEANMSAMTPITHNINTSRGDAIKSTIQAVAPGVSIDDTTSATDAYMKSKRQTVVSKNEGRATGW